LALPSDMAACATHVCGECYTFPTGRFRTLLDTFGHFWPVFDGVFPVLAGVAGRTSERCLPREDCSETCSRMARHPDASRPPRLLGANDACRAPPPCCKAIGPGRMRNSRQSRILHDGRPRGPAGFGHFWTLLDTFGQFSTGTFPVLATSPERTCIRLSTGGRFAPSAGTLSASPQPNGCCL